MALATSDFPQPTTLSSRRPYTYTKICDLQSGSKMTNVMGVVSLFKAPYMSRGTDYSCTVDLVDEGCPTHSFPVIFFSRNVDKLPQTCCVGDVLCVRGVDIAQFNQRLQGKCRSLFSWLLWDGKRKGRKDPARSSDGSFWDSYEVDRAEQLIRWTTSLNSDSDPQLLYVPTTSPLRPTLKPIADLSLADRKINFVGVIKTVSPPQKSRGPDFFTSVVLIDETSQVEGMPFTFFNPQESQLPEMAAPGSVAYLCNMELSEYEGRLQARGHERSKGVCFKKQSDGRIISTRPNLEVPVVVKQRVKALLEWVVSAQPLLEDLEDSALDNPASATSIVCHSPSRPSFKPPTYLTLIFHPTWEISSLISILLADRVPSCFRTRVKVLQVLQPLEECCQLRCPQCKYKFSSSQKAGTVCTHCKKEGKADASKLRYMFCLSLLVQDNSTSLEVHLTDTDADEFFRDLSPSNFVEDASIQQELWKILSALVGGTDPFLLSTSNDFHPWIDCCIQTYPSHKGTQFRIVDTWFIK